jgi:hypothetical protein
MTDQKAKSVALESVYRRPADLAMVSVEVCKLEMFLRRYGVRLWPETPRPTPADDHPHD